MLLLLEEAPGLATADLLARVGKDGTPEVRGPVVDVRSAEGAALSVLRTGDKLHIVATERVAGMEPRALVEFLVRLGLRPEMRLKQVHLLAGRTGAGGQASYAGQLDAELRAAGFDVQEIKAPVGAVRCNPVGKAEIRLDGSESWVPSGPALNYYCGPAVQPKHMDRGSN